VALRDNQTNEHPFDEEEVKKRVAALVKADERNVNATHRTQAEGKEPGKWP
jgi:hypothetical protein